MLNRIVIVLSITLLIAIVTLIQGCHHGFRRHYADVNTDVTVPDSPKRALAKVVYKTNWMVTLSTIGVAASVFAIMMGLGRVGMAGLVASAASAAYTMAVIRYAWLVALGGLLVGIVAAMAGFMKNRKTIFGFIDASQDIKDRFFPKSDGDWFKESDVKRAAVNNILKRVPIDDKVVAKCKGRL